MNIITYFSEFYLLIKEAIDQVLITKPIDSRKIVLDKKSLLLADEKLDITKEVIALLNKKLKTIKLN